VKSILCVSSVHASSYALFDTLWLDDMMFTLLIVYN